jgi:hypothetical protein
VVQIRRAGERVLKSSPINVLEARRQSLSLYEQDTILIARGVSEKQKKK